MKIINFLSDFSFSFTITLELTLTWNCQFIRKPSIKRHLSHTLACATAQIFRNSIFPGSIVSLLRVEKHSYSMMPLDEGFANKCFKENKVVSGMCCLQNTHYTGVRNLIFLQISRPICHNHCLMILHILHTFS